MADRTTLKSYFETGDSPSQAEFESFIDSSVVNGATEKTTPVDADMVGLVDSADSSALKKLTWANIKATLATVFQAILVSGTNIKTINSTSLLGSGDIPIVSDIASSINSATAKTTPVDADLVGIVDSADSNLLKKLTWANIKATLKTYFDTLYSRLLTTSNSMTDVIDVLGLTIGEGNFQAVIFDGGGNGVGYEVYTYSQDLVKNVPACGYYEYVAKISQTGTSNPTLTVIKNTLGTFTITRGGIGTYTLTATSLLTIGKTFVNMSYSSFFAEDPYRLDVTTQLVDDDSVSILTFIDEVIADSSFAPDSTISIRVYL